MSEGPGAISEDFGKKKKKESSFSTRIVILMKSVHFGLYLNVFLQMVFFVYFFIIWNFLLLYLF